MIRPARRKYRYVNWDGTRRCVAACLFEPEDEGDVQEVVRRAAVDGVKVKPIGSRHSWSAAPCTDGYMVSLRRMNRLVSVDRASEQVTVEAGILLKDLNDLLPRYGLALRLLGSTSEQTFSGAMSTGTHGTGVAFGNLSTFVVALRMVTGDGRIVAMTEETHGEAFRCARQSAGAFGIVTQVTIQCRRAFRMVERNYPLAFDDVLARLDVLLKENRHFKIYWFPYHPKCKIITFNPSEDAISRPNALVRWFEDKILFYWTMTVLLRIGYVVPALVPALNRFAGSVAFKKERFVERSDEIFNIPLPAKHDETEYAIPPDRVVECLRELRALIEGGRLPVNFALEARWVAADENPLSPTYRRAGCYIGAYAFGRRFTEAYFPAFWALMRRYDGRPHLGKNVEPGLDAARAFPALSTFDAVRREYDPRGVFETPFIRDLLRGDA